jgi:hypothetical protein
MGKADTIFSPTKILPLFYLPPLRSLILENRDTSDFS